MPDKNNNLTSKELKVQAKLKLVQKSTIEQADKNKNNDVKKQSPNYFKILIKLVFGVLITLNILAPIVIYSWPNIMSHMIFENFIYIPFKNLSDPEGYSLHDTYTFRLEHDFVSLGAWHVLPESAKLQPSTSVEEHFATNFEQQDNEKTIIVLYLHGNTNDRSTSHRVSLYKVLRSLGYHIIAFDYRGYGDSTGTPTELDVVKDALYTHDYIRKRVPWATIYIWGHSLGTGIASHMARMLTETNQPPPGIVLEAPFFNIVEEVEFHPFFWVFYFNSLVLTAIEDSLLKINLQFRSDIHLTKVSSKIMIMHSEDDLIIPIFQGEKLYRAISENGITNNLTFHRIPGYNFCGHNNIYSFQNISTMIKDFIV